MAKKSKYQRAKEFVEIFESSLGYDYACEYLRYIERGCIEDERPVPRWTDGGLYGPVSITDKCAREIREGLHKIMGY